MNNHTITKEATEISPNVIEDIDTIIDFLNAYKSGYTDISHIVVQAFITSTDTTFNTIAVNIE